MLDEGNIMKKFILVSTAVLAMWAIGTTAHAQTWVNGYYKSNGTYVQGHHRSSPNNSVSDNYSYKGNNNPYTGETGTKTYGCYPYCD
jgi:hypothetical protein